MGYVDDSGGGDYSGGGIGGGRDSSDGGGGSYGRDFSGGGGGGYGYSGGGGGGQDTSGADTGSMDTSGADASGPSAGDTGGAAGGAGDATGAGGGGGPGVVQGGGYGAPSRGAQGGGYGTFYTGPGRTSGFGAPGDTAQVGVGGTMGPGSAITGAGGSGIFAAAPGGGGGVGAPAGPGDALALSRDSALLAGQGDPFSVGPGTVPPTDTASAGPMVSPDLQRLIDQSATEDAANEQLIGPQYDPGTQLPSPTFDAPTPGPPMAPGTEQADALAGTQFAELGTSDVPLNASDQLAANATWFNTKGGQTTLTNPQGKTQDWTDPTTSGFPASGMDPNIPGIATAGSAGLGKFFQFTDPSGMNVVVPKTDIGPPGVTDLNAPLANLLNLNPAQGTYNIGAPSQLSSADLAALQNVPLPTARPSGDAVAFDGSDAIGTVPPTMDAYKNTMLTDANLAALDKSMILQNMVGPPDTLTEVDRAIVAPSGDQPAFNVVPPTETRAPTLDVASLDTSVGPTLRGTGGTSNFAGYAPGGVFTGTDPGLLAEDVQAPGSMPPSPASPGPDLNQPFFQSLPNAPSFTLPGTLQNDPNTLTAPTPAEQVASRFPAPAPDLGPKVVTPEIVRPPSSAPTVPSSDQPPSTPGLPPGSTSPGGETALAGTPAGAVAGTSLGTDIGTRGQFEGGPTAGGPGRGLPPAPVLINALTQGASPAVQQAVGGLTAAQQTQVSQFAFGLMNQWRQVLSQQTANPEATPQWQQVILPNIQQQTQAFILQVAGSGDTRAAAQARQILSAA